MKRLGVRYPVALDNDYATWNAYRNHYWPADYLIDHAATSATSTSAKATTTDRTEIRRCSGRGCRPPATRLTTRPHARELRTPESYLGYARIGNYAGSPVRPDRPAAYRFPASLAGDSFAYAGTWSVESERILAGRDARLRLNFLARSVHLVLGGRGVVHVKLNGKPLRTVNVTADKLYTLAAQREPREGLLELSFTPGISAYAFTFG